MSRAFVLQASILVLFLAGSSAPTPLYPVYQAAWGLSPVTITVIFGVYAVAVLAALLVLGSLSDHVGRRPVLLVATLAQVATMAIFASAHGLGALLAARVLQGVATGGAASAAAAGMIDVDRERGTFANGLVPMLGTGTGSLVGGLFVQFLPAPTQLVYVVLGVVFLAQAACVAVMPESVSRRAGAWASMRPHLDVPARMRGAVLLAAPALVAAWALAGFYGSLGPTLVRKLLASSSAVAGGLALFVLACSGVVAVVLARGRTPRQTMTLGTSGLVGGVGIVLWGVSAGSLALFFLGTAIAGAGFGGSFQGAVRSVVSLAAPHERAGVLSVLYVICYLAMGLPAILAGLRVVHGGGIASTAHEYGAAVMLLAAAALVGSRWRPAYRPGVSASTQSP